MTWRTVTLREIANDIQSGFAKQPTYDGSGVPQLRTNNVSEDGNIDLSVLKSVLATKREQEQYALRPGDILFNNTNSPALVGKTALFNVQGNFLFSNHMTRIRINRAVAHSGFVARYLFWSWRQGLFRSVVTQWVNQAAINQTQLARVHIPLPPLSEQQRIVELLDQANQLKAKRAIADAKTQRFVPAIFATMFGDPARNPKNFPSSTVGKLSDIQGGLQLSGKRSQYPIEIPYLRVANVFRDRLELSEIKVLHVTPQEKQRCLLKAGDLLVVEGHGNKDEIGRCAVWDGSVPECVHQNHLIRVRTDTRRLLPKFLSRYLNSSAGRSHLIKAGKTTSGLNTISVANVRATPISLPPIELQHAFVSILNKADEAANEQARAAKKLDRVVETLLLRAFNGELTANWRNANARELLREVEDQARILERTEMRQLAQ